MEWQFFVRTVASNFHPCWPHAQSQLPHFRPPYPAPLPPPFPPTNARTKAQVTLKCPSLLLLQPEKLNSQILLCTTVQATTEVCVCSRGGKPCTDIQCTLLGKLRSASHYICAVYVLCGFSVLNGLAEAPRCAVEVGLKSPKLAYFNIMFNHDSWVYSPYFLS